MKLCLAFLLLFFCLCVRSGPWDGQVALIFVGPSDEQSCLTGIYVNPQFSHSCNYPTTHSVYSNIFLPVSEENIGGFKIDYDYVGEWIYTGGFSDSGSYHISRYNTVTHHTVILPSSATNFIADWTLGVELNQLFYIDLSLSVYSIPIGGGSTPSSPVDFPKSNYQPVMLAYDTATNYVYSSDLTGTVYRFTNQTNAELVVSLAIIAQMHGCVATNDLFVFDDTFIFGFICNRTQFYIGEYLVPLRRFNMISSFYLPSRNYTDAVVKGVSWETNLITWMGSWQSGNQTKYETYSISFMGDNNQTLIASYGVGPAYFFPPADNQTNPASQSCSFSGQLNSNGTCTCDSTNFGEICSVYCSPSYNCFNGQCDANGQCTCELGFFFNETTMTCQILVPPPQYPPEFFSSLMITNLRLSNSSFPADYYFSTSQNTEQYVFTSNENVFVLNNYRSGFQYQGNGEHCAAVTITGTLPLYYMPADSVLLPTNFTYHGIPDCQVWEAENGTIIKITTTLQGSIVPLFINNSVDFVLMEFNLSSTALSFPDYSWMDNTFCSDCENNPNSPACVSSTPSFHSSPSSSHTRTPSRTPSSTHTPTTSTSPTPTNSLTGTPTISYSSSKTVSLSPSPSTSFSPSTSHSSSPTHTDSAPTVTEQPSVTNSNNAKWIAPIIILSVAVIFLLVIVIILAYLLYAKTKKSKYLIEEENLLN